MSYRRLVALLHNAPPGSAFARAYHGEAGEWTVTDYLLAEVIDLLGVVASGEHIKRPKPHPRPLTKAQQEQAAAKPRRPFWE